MLSEKQKRFLYSEKNRNRLKSFNDNNIGIPSSSWNYNKTTETDERLKEIGRKISLNAKDNPNFGNRGRIFSDETRKKMSESFKYRGKNKINIICPVCNRPTFKSEKGLCLSCFNAYLRFEKDMINPPENKPIQIWVCKCGKLIFKSMNGMCYTCWNKEYYNQNGDNLRLKQRERVRNFIRNDSEGYRQKKSKINLKSRLKNKKHYKEYKKNYLFIKKTDPFFQWKTYIQKYSWELREEFANLRGNKCEDCSSTEKLEIHHKEYTKNFVDWKLLCKKCHSKLSRIIGVLEVQDGG